MIAWPAVLRALAACFASANNFAFGKTKGAAATCTVKGCARPGSAEHANSCEIESSMQDRSVFVPSRFAPPSMSTYKYGGTFVHAEAAPCMMTLVVLRLNNHVHLRLQHWASWSCPLPLARGFFRDQEPIWKDQWQQLLYDRCRHPCRNHAGGKYVGLCDVMCHIQQDGTLCSLLSWSCRRCLKVLRQALPRL